MKRILILFSVLCSLSVSGYVESAEIKSMRIWPSPEKTRIVFDLTSSIQYKVFSLKAPNRLVIDFIGMSFKKPLNKIDLKGTRIQKIRHSNRKGQIFRVVFDLSQPLAVNHFKLLPNEYYGHRLVIDLNLSERASILALFAQDLPVPEKNQTDPIRSKRRAAKKFVVAIDAGHGGEDPGAIGRYGTYEKHVVLAIAKYLKQALDRKPNMRGVLIRKGDYYIPLYQRIKRSRQIKADFFVSIHADAAHNRKAQGASVYVLSRRGASSAAAKWLAKSANQSDLIGGVNVKEQGNMLASVLLDLSQTASKEQSLKAAKAVLKSLSSVAVIHKKQVGAAGFAVLKAPDIPSILVEAGFISNPKIERKLRTQHYQKQLAKAISVGICQYRQHHLN